jgi:hypothetical protein
MFYHAFPCMENPNRTTGSHACPLVRLGFGLLAF